MVPSVSIVEGVQWSIGRGIELTEVLHSANDGMDGAEGWRARAAEANELPPYSILLRGELQGHKGGGEEVSIRTCVPVQAALSNEEVYITDAEGCGLR
jgi:hypothetical protein